MVRTKKVGNWEIQEFETFVYLENRKTNVSVMCHTSGNVKVNGEYVYEYGKIVKKGE